MKTVMACKLVLLCMLSISITLVAAQDACHIGSPACGSSNPDSIASFADCCNTFTPRQRQDSYGSGPGSDSCIRCATLGCHVDKNCASETGVEVDSYEECCAMRNRRSWRNSISGTCHLCNNCYKSKNCKGNGNNAAYADTLDECCALPGQGSYYDTDTETCQTCPDAPDTGGDGLVCFLGENCDDEGTSAASFSDCCSKPGAGSYKNPNTDVCEPCSGNPPDIYGDPHFIVPLLSNESLCYSIQGYPGLAFNLIYNKNFIINAQFVDSVGDTSEATWIGKLAVIPHNSNSSDAIVFDSVDQKVTVAGRGSFKVSLIRKIIINKDGNIKFIQGIEKQIGNPTVHVSYTNPQADFDVNFHSNHLNVDWNVQYDEFAEMHGLMGQFMGKGVHINTQKQLLVYSDGRDPVPVTRDSTMTGGSGKECWKAMNFGHQGEGLILGKILNYMVPHLLSDELNI